MPQRFPTEKATEVSVPSNDMEQTLAFKIVDGEPLYMDFLPPITKVYDKAPVLLLVCGGGWKEQCRASILAMMSTAVRALRDKGFAVLCADYRLVDGGDLTTEHQVADLMDALRYISHYAHCFTIDPKRIATMGHSAGAHLALMVGLAPHDIFSCGDFGDAFTVFANVGFGGVYFMYKHTLFRDIDWTYAVSPNGLYDEALGIKCSPYTYVNADSAPSLLIHGSEDDVTHPKNSILTYDKAVAVDANFTLVLADNGGHVLEAMDKSKPVMPNLIDAQLLAVDWIISKYI